MTANPLYCLAYISSSIGLFSQADLDDILAASRRNNAADGITGLLLYHDGNIFQVLEGPEDTVRTCYARIEQDSRHTGCIVLLSQPMRDRNFASWDMPYVPFARLNTACRESFLDLDRFRETAKMREAMKDEEIKTFVDTFLRNLRDL
jgi:hypothetical protein